MSDHATHEQALPREDVDILADIHSLVAHYPPLAHDQHFFKFEVADGDVTVTGYLRSGVSYAFIEGKVPAIDGVKALHLNGLFVDEHLRLHVGRTVPHGVFVNVDYGTVILTGKLPAEMTVEQVVEQVATVSGVNRVLTNLK